MKSNEASLVSRLAGQRSYERLSGIKLPSKVIGTTPGYAPAIGSVELLYVTISTIESLRSSSTTCSSKLVAPAAGPSSRVMILPPDQAAYFIRRNATGVLGLGSYTATFGRLPTPG